MKIKSPRASNLSANTISPDSTVHTIKATKSSPELWRFPTRIPQRMGINFSPQHSPVTDSLVIDESGKVSFNSRAWEDKVRLFAFDFSNLFFVNGGGRWSLVVTLIELLLLIFPFLPVLMLNYSSTVKSQSPLSLSSPSTHLIRFRTSCGSGGFGRRCSQIATIPATIIDVTMTNPAAITPATITSVDFRSFSSRVDVSAGFGSSTDDPTSPEPCWG